jgi:cytochrome c biogenesis protein CcdA
MQAVQPDYSWKAPGIRIITSVCVILSVLSGLVSGGVFFQNGSDAAGNDTPETILAESNATPDDCSIVFFYNTHCGACHLAMSYLNEYNAAHPGVIINSHDIFNSSENKALFEQYKKEYNRSYVSVPVVYTGNLGLEGEAAIRENFDSLVSRCYNSQNASVSLTGLKPGTGVKTHRTVISIPLVLIAGIVDGINPCAVAVLVFLLTLLIIIRQRQRVILAGTVFTTAVFFFYFITGAGIFSITGTTGVVKVFSLIAGVLAVLAALLYFLEAFFPGKGTGSMISETGKEKIISTCAKMTIPAAFILGLLSGVLELPCAGGIYISILDMIAFKVNAVQGLVYLILYNLAFIIPLLLITSIVFLAMKPGENGEMEESSEKKRGVRIFIGLFLLVFAFLVLSGLL